MGVQGREGCFLLSSLLWTRHKVQPKMWASILASFFPPKVRTEVVEARLGGCSTLGKEGAVLLSAGKERGGGGRNYPAAWHVGLLSFLSQRMAGFLGNDALWLIVNAPVVAGHSANQRSTSR